MESELPSQRNCLAHLMLQTLGMLKQGKITSGLGLNSIVSERTDCKDYKKADIMTTRLMATELKIKNTV